MRGGHQTENISIHIKRSHELQRESSSQKIPSEMMLCNLVVCGLGVVIILFTYTRCAEGKSVIKCKNDNDCASKYFKCHRHFKLCILYSKSQPSLRTARKPPSCNCHSNEYCHPLFNQCFPNLTSPATRNNKKAALSDCKNNSDCTTGKYCHNKFKKCLDSPMIPTVSTTRSSSVSCRNNSQCTALQYCHHFFEICLVKHTAANATATPNLVCLSTLDCKTGHYCNNHTKVCSPVGTLGNVTTSVTSRRSCNVNSDCKTTEFCARIFKPGISQLVRLRRKSLNSSGMCLPRSIALKPPYLSCVHDKDCEQGKCCFKNFGICKKVSKQSHMC